MAASLTTTPSIFHRTALVVASTVAAALLLAGCSAPADDSSSSPTPEASSTPSASATPEEVRVDLTNPPASEEAAMAAAEVTLDSFVSLLSTIFAEGGASPERINEIAYSPVNTEIMEQAAAVSARGLVFTGAITAEVTGGSAQDLGQTTGETVPFGLVRLVTCYDTSTQTISLPNGDPSPRPELLKIVAGVAVAYSSSNQGWYISSIDTTQEAC